MSLQTVLATNDETAPPRFRPHARHRPDASLRVLRSLEITTNYAESLVQAALPSRVYSRGDNQLLTEKPVFSKEFLIKHKTLGTKMYFIFGSQSPCPFVVIQDESDLDYMGNDLEYAPHYYLWLFGSEDQAAV